MTEQKAPGSCPLAERRAIEALQWMADGRGTFADFAKEHGIVHSTVRNYMRIFYQNRGLDSGFHAIAVGFREGWLE